MSTNDVPGANPKNKDELAVGCWAENPDAGGSLIFVEGVDENRVVYVMFDLSKDPILQYRDAMPLTDFKKEFSWGLGKIKVKWVWHDKTPFDWNRVIKKGLPSGVGYVSATDQLKAADDLKNALVPQTQSAASKVADQLNLKATEFVAEKYASLTPKERKRFLSAASIIENLLNRLK